MTFFLNENEEFYVRQLEKLFKSSVGNIRRELIRLEMDNIICRREFANLVLYKVNTEASFFKDIKKIVLTVVIQELLAPIFNSDIFKAVFIYGSYAKGDFQKNSDIDLFILCSNELDDVLYEALNTEIALIEKEINREINLDIRTEDELLIAMVGKEPYILDILSGKMIFVKGGESDIRSGTGK